MKRALLIGLAGIILMLLHTEKVCAGTVNADSAVYYRELGNREMQARRYSVAWSYYEKAAGFSPDNTGIYKSISEVCLKMNKPAPALKALETAHRLDPGDKDVVFGLTELYFSFGQSREVIALAQTIRQNKWEMKGLNYMTGKSYHLLQDYGKSIEYFRLAIKEDPQNADAIYLTGRMYASMSNYQLAIPYYANYFKLDTTNAGRYYEYALILATGGDFTASIQWFRKSLEKGYPARDDFYMNLANTYADAQQTDKAIRMMEEVLQRRPHDLHIFTSLAEMHYHSGQYEKAIGYWDRILQYEEKNARALYMIGVSYIKMGKDADGKQLCDKAIAMDPSLKVLRHEIKR